MESFLNEVGSYIEADLWGTLEEATGISLESDVMGLLGLPDPSKVADRIESAINGKVSGNEGELPGESYQLDAGLEGYNSPSSSYLLLARMQGRAFQDAARQQAQASALSKFAQENKRKQQEVAANSLGLMWGLSALDQDSASSSVGLVQESSTLASESNSTDVSQNILRNLSEQSSLTSQALSNQSAQLANQSAQLGELGQLEQIQVMQGQEAQATRAYETTLTADIAEEMQQEATRTRRSQVGLSRQLMAKGALSQFGGSFVGSAGVGEDVGDD